MFFHPISLLLGLFSFLPPLIHTQTGVNRNDFEPLKFIWLAKQGVTFNDPAQEISTPITGGTKFSYTYGMSQINPAVLDRNFPSMVSSVSYVIRMQIPAAHLDNTDISKFTLTISWPSKDGVGVSTTYSLANLCLKMSIENPIIFNTSPSCMIPADGVTQSKMQFNIYGTIKVQSCSVISYTHSFSQYLLSVMRRAYSPDLTLTTSGCVTSVTPRPSVGAVDPDLGYCTDLMIDYKNMTFKMEYDHSHLSPLATTGFWARIVLNQLNVYPVIGMKLYPDVDLVGAVPPYPLCTSTSQDQFEGNPIELRYDFPLIDFDQASIFDIKLNTSNRLDPDGSANLDLTNVKRQSNSFDLVDKNLVFYSQLITGVANTFEGSGILTAWFMIRKLGPATAADLSDLTQLRTRFRTPKSSAFINFAIYVNFRDDAPAGTAWSQPESGFDPDRRFFAAFVSAGPTTSSHTECNFMPANFIMSTAKSSNTPYVLMTKQWYQLKIHAQYKYQGQFAAIEVSISSTDNPYRAFLYADKSTARHPTSASASCTFNDFQMTGSNEQTRFMFALDEFGVNYYNGRIGEIKYFQGNLGYFRRNDQFGSAATQPSSILKPFNDNFLPYCLEGYNYRYFILNSTAIYVPANGYQYAEISDRYCFMCSSETAKTTSNTSYYHRVNPPASYPPSGKEWLKWMYSQMLWNEGHCSLRCNPWRKEDRKAGTCHEFQTILPYYDFSVNGPDSVICGDTYLQDGTGGESCEPFSITGLVPISSTTNICNNDCSIMSNQQDNICRKDPYGKSSCEKCSLELCNLKKNKEFYFKKCISVCQYVFDANVFIVKVIDAQKNTKGGAITQGDKAYYYDEKTLQQILCESSEINIQDKMADPVKAMRNCDLCVQSAFFYKDSRLQMCFEVERNPVQIYPFKDQLITDSGIDIIGYVINAIAIAMVLIALLYLFPIHCIAVFFRFWELMQFFYMMSYYIDRNFQTHQFFRKFTFVTFEIFNFKGWAIPNLLSLILPSTGVILVDDAYKNLLSQIEFATYKDKMKTYMQMGKVGLVTFDAGAILDITAAIVLLMVLTSIVMTVIGKKSTNEDTLKFVQEFKKTTSSAYPTFFTWFVIENLPIFYFYCFAQMYMIPSRVSNIYLPILLINKLFLFLFFSAALIGLPIYTVGVATRVFRDPVMLQRIKGIGFKNTGIALRTLYPISILRRLLFTMFFAPSINSSGNTFFLFLIVIVEIIELNILFFSESWQYQVVTFLQILGSLVLLSLSLILMADRLMNTVFQLAKVGSSNYNLLSFYYQWRERALVVGVLTIILMYILGVVYALINLRKTIAVSRQNNGKHTDNDEYEDDETGPLKVEDDADRKHGIELGAL